MMEPQRKNPKPEASPGQEAELTAARLAAIVESDEVPVSVTISPITDSAGTIVGASKIARDITRQKQHEHELARLTRLYAALSKVNQAIVRSPTREVLFPKVCQALVGQGGFPMAWVGRHDPLTQRLMPVAIRGDENGDIRGIEIHADEHPGGCGPFGLAFRTGRPCLSHDALNDPVMLQWRPELVRRGLKALAVFPIRLKNEVWGTLAVYSDEPWFFQDKEIALLAEAAGDISFALDNFADKESLKQREIAAENERHFSATMIESMPGIVYFYDADGRFVRWNRNFEIVSGYSADEIAGMHPLDFFTNSEKEALKERIASVFETGESSIEASFLARDGTTTPYFFTGRRVVFEGRTCLLGMGVDISQRTRAEAKLRESLARFHAAAQATNDVIWDWNLGAGSIWWNDNFQTTFGYEPQEIEAGIESWIGRLHPGDRDRVVKGIHAVIEGAGEAWSDEYRLRRGDGSYAEVFDRGHVLRDEAGAALRMVGAIQDITARKRAEEALHELNASLEDKVAARTDELRTALLRAEAADRIKSAFLATMSHELRTPLNSIIGFTGIVIQGLAGPLNPEQTKQLGMVRSSARHLLDLINDILDISKIEAGQLEVHAEPFGLKSSIEHVVKLVQPMAEKKGLELTLVAAADPGEMVSDKRRVEQILLNLLTNAIKFTDHGRVTVTVEIVEAGESPPEGPPLQAVSLRVEDTGIGITPENLATLFQPFRQVDSGLTRQHEGTGLGLAICRRLATLLGGRISATSAWGKGSVFTVTIPLHRPTTP